MKHETFKSIYPFLENALASFIEVLRHWVMWWKPPAICHGFSNFIFSSVPRKGVSLVYSWVHQATPVFKLQTANCSPARVKIHCRPLLRTWGRRGFSRGEHPVGNLRNSKAYPEISHNQNDPVVVRETGLGGKHWWNGKKSGFFGNKIRWNKNMFNC